MADRKLKLSRRQERRTADEYGAKLSPQSGAGWSKKNDSRTDMLLIENKRTDNKRSITLQFTDLRDLESHAIREGKIGMLVFELNGRSYEVVPGGTIRDLIDSGS